MHVYTCKSEIPKVNFLLFIFSFIFEPKFVTVTSKREIQILLIKSSLVYLDWSFSCFNVQNAPTVITLTLFCLQTNPGLKKRNVATCPGKHWATALGREVLTEKVLIWPLAAGISSHVVGMDFSSSSPDNTIKHKTGLLPQPLTTYRDCPFLSLVLVLVGLHWVEKLPYLLIGNGRQEWDQDLESSGTQNVQHLLLDCGTRTSNGSNDMRYAPFPKEHSLFFICYLFFMNSGNV